MTTRARAARSVVLVALATGAACQGRPRTELGEGSGRASSAAPGDPHLGEIDLRAGVEERPAGSLFGSASGRSFADLVLRLREAKKDETLRGALVRLGASRLAPARADEIGRALAEIRATGRPVVCHADALGNGSMLLAARGCDRIWLSAAGSVDTVGLAAELVFGKRLLEKLSIDADFVQVGRFKGASEPFTRDAPSPEARASLEAALGAVRAAWIAGIEQGRGGRSADALGVEDGPHTADDALARGLIDAVGDEAAARKDALARAGVSARAETFGRRRDEIGGVAEILRLLAGTSGARVPHVAVVRAVGAITLGGGGSLFGSEGIGARELRPLLERLAADDAARAVVVRIDSPGGSALASDLLWGALVELRKKKPLVVSVGALAASGGYYLASAATKVVAERASILGSIGVVGGKLTVARSLDELGIGVVAVPARPGADARALHLSPLRPWDDATRDKVRAAIESAYRLFVARIAEGRGIDAERVQAAAEGRLMGGDDAKAAGLVDEIGGLGRAVDLAIELAGAEAGLLVRVVEEPSGLFGILGLDDADEEARGERGRLGPALGGAPGGAGATLEARLALHVAAALGDGLVPLRAEVMGWLGAWAPLWRGEICIAALPFALALR
jgi:protease-4